jgi:hypothetical protein
MSVEEPPDAAADDGIDGTVGPETSGPETSVPAPVTEPIPADHAMAAFREADAAVQRVEEAAQEAAKGVEAARSALQRLRSATAASMKGRDADTARRGAVIGEPVRPADRAANRRRRQLEQEALPAARATAEKWAATTAVLFTALGFATIIQGRKQIRALAPGYENWAAGAFLAAFAVALLSILSAAWAAQGASPLRALKLPAASMLDYESTRARKVGQWLAASRVLAAVAIVGVLTGLGLLFYAPSDESAGGPQVLVVTRAGGLICGTLISRSDRGELVIDPGGNEPESVVRATNALTITAVDECPSPGAAEGQ